MKIARNDVCTCGSGKKYKKCCLDAHQKEQYLLKKNRQDIPHFTIEYRPDIEEACDDALKFLEDGDILRAKELAAPLIDAYPDNHHVLFLQGNCFIYEKKYTDAIAAFEKAVEIFPLFSEAFYNLAGLYQNSCQIPKCIHCFRQVIRFEDESSPLGRLAEEGINKIAQILQKNGGMSIDKYIKSAEMFDQAFECLKREKCEEAIYYFQQTLMLNPNHVQSYGNMALAYSALGKNQKALECLDKALSLDPNYEPAILNRQNISQLEENEKINAKIQEVRYYESKVEKNHNIIDRFTPIKI